MPLTGARGPIDVKRLARQTDVGTAAHICPQNHTPTVQNHVGTSDNGCHPSAVSKGWAGRHPERMAEKWAPNNSTLPFHLAAARSMRIPELHSNGYTATYVRSSHNHIHTSGYTRI